MADDKPRDFGDILRVLAERSVATADKESRQSKKGKYYSNKLAGANYHLGKAKKSWSVTGTAYHLWRAARKYESLLKLLETENMQSSAEYQTAIDGLIDVQIGRGNAPLAARYTQEALGKTKGRKYYGSNNQSLGTFESNSQLQQIIADEGALGAFVVIRGGDDLFLDTRVPAIENLEAALVTEGEGAGRINKNIVTQLRDLYGQKDVDQISAQAYLQGKNESIGRNEGPIATIDTKTNLVGNAVKIMKDIEQIDFDDYLTGPKKKTKKKETKKKKTKKKETKSKKPTAPYLRLPTSVDTTDSLDSEIGIARAKAHTYIQSEVDKILGKYNADNIKKENRSRLDYKLKKVEQALYSKLEHHLSAYREKQTEKIATNALAGISADLLFKEANAIMDQGDDLFGKQQKGKEDGALGKYLQAIEKYEALLDKLIPLEQSPPVKELKAKILYNMGLCRTADSKQNPVTAFANFVDAPHLTQDNNLLKDIYKQRDTELVKLSEL
jgi:hypothetical protein